MTDELKFNNRIRMWRADLRLSQEELADMVSVSRQTISSIENLQFCPSARLALLICTALGKKFEDVFYFE
jgi:putative transcriptional regulator